MVSTRAHDGESSPSTGDKRAADASAHDGGSPKKVKKVVSPSHKKGEAKGDSTVKTEDETKAQDNEAGERAKKDDDEQSAEKRPDGMEEAKRDEEPQGPTAEGNAQPGEIPAHLPKEDLERKHGILEKGYVYFVYKPKVETEHPESLDDVSKFHLILNPHGTKLHRLIAIGKKALPDASESSRPIWGQVMSVGEDMKAFKDGLGPSTYETKTRGTRHQPGARVAAAGAYVLHATENPPENSANASAVYHTHFAYEIAVPHDMGEVQEGLHIQHEGVFTLQVKNPEATTTNPRVGRQPADKHPQFPPELKQYFTTKFIPSNPAAFLDYPGAELLLVPSKHTAEQDIGQSAEKELDSEEKDLEKEIDKQKGGNEAKKALKEMGLEGLAEGKALEGHWE